MKNQKSKVKICHFSSVHKALDTRVFFKECKSLANAGYDVTLIARYDKEEIKEGVRIVPFNLYSNRIKRVLFSPFRMLRMTLKQKAALYHFHDPELIPVGIMLRLLGKKVIYDVHEDVAKQLLDKSYFRFRFIARLLAFLAWVTEKTGELFFSHIIAATPSIAGNFRPAKTTIVRNVPLLTLFHSNVSIDIKKEKPVVAYVGVLAKTRGLVQMVQAMEYVGDKAEMWLVGNWENESIEKECRSQKGWKNVRYFGTRPQEEAYAYMKAGDIGIVNFLPLANHLNSLPNKIFEYMTLGMPAVLSNFPFWRESFDHFALFADPEKPQEIAQRIMEFLAHPALIETKGKSGKAFIDSGYSWDKEEQVLFGVYKTLLPRA